MKKLLLLLFASAVTPCFAQYIQLEDIEGREIRAVILSKGIESVELVRQDGARFVIPLDRFSEQSQDKIKNAEVSHFSVQVSSTGRPDNPKTSMDRSQYRIIIFAGKTPLIGFYPDEIGILREAFASAAETYRKRGDGKLESSANIDVFDEYRRRGRRIEKPPLMWMINFLDTGFPLSVPPIYTPAPLSFDDQSILDTKSDAFQSKQIDPFAAMPRMDYIKISGHDALALSIYLNDLDPNEEIRKATSRGR